MGTSVEFDPATFGPLELLPELPAADGFVAVVEPTVVGEVLKRAAKSLFAKPDSGFVTLAPPAVLQW